MEHVLYPVPESGTCATFRTGLSSEILKGACSPLHGLVLDVSEYLIQAMSDVADHLVTSGQPRELRQTTIRSKTDLT